MFDVKFSTPKHTLQFTFITDKAKRWVKHHNISFEKWSKLKDLSNIIDAIDMYATDMIISMKRDGLKVEIE